MMSRLRAGLVGLLIAFFSFAFSAQAAFLTGNAVQDMNLNTEKVQQAAGYDGSITLGVAVGLIIKAFLGVLGMIFLILLLVAGYNLMTAAGDEEKIKKATTTIRAAIIGLMIIVAAYAITYFVFANLPK